MLDDRSASIKDLGKFLSDRYLAKRLTEGEMQGIGISPSSYTASWRILTDIKHPENGKAIELIVAAKPSFPFKVPHIFTLPMLEVLKHPHVEKQGRLCIWGEDVMFDPQVITYVEHLINDSYSLVEKTVSGGLDEDFSAGMLSYWERSFTAPAKEKKATSLCNVKNLTSRRIHVAYTSTNGVIFADTKGELISWLTNIGLKPSQKILSTTLLINLSDAWKPSEYPTTLGEILEILETQSTVKNDAITSISYILRSNLTSPAFLVQTNTTNGAIITAMRCVSGIRTRGNAGQHNLPPVKIGNGFRDDRIPLRDLKIRCSQAGIRGMKVERRDPSWVLGRDSNPFLSTISGTTIGIIGLGSVGASLLPQLIKAGFSRFVLCDGESLEAANVGRHLLGINYVGTNKAEACKSYIQSNYPWVEILHTGNLDWFLDNEAIEVLTTKCDLVISATADWASDKAIEEIINNNSLSCSVVFCFTEAHAVATHCYVNKAGSFSYGSLFDNTGSLLNSCAKFERRTIKKTHFCGGIFQPYGAVELSFGHSMIVEVVTELACEGVSDSSYHVWVGSQKLLQSVDGQWNQDWVKKYGEIGDGSKILRVF